MTDAVPFLTRARTIDHLGREQIADVPTAISELWKNAYDAYAQHVALHIYGGMSPVAAIVDDGHGMNRDQFVNSWLVVGTESKAGSNKVPETWRQGLPERPRQGQKGIGRLSVAALGSRVLVVSKHKASPFVACLIDWRLFENPYLFLEDVRLPVREFNSPSELKALLPEMRVTLTENLTGSGGTEDRKARIIAAWSAFDKVEIPSEVEQENRETTSFQILQAALSDWPDVDHLRHWPVWTGDHPCGTAMVIGNINRGLEAWVLEGETALSDEASSVRESLKRTLTGFSDPYEENEKGVLDYRVVVHSRQGPRVVVGREEGYGRNFLRSLEHCLEGDFDEFGIFRGQARAFGRDLGAFELVPARPLPTATKDRIGPFSICIGAFEIERKSSILSDEVHGQVSERAEIHSGLCAYRDGLRVMPYGRPENDFFKIEERRQFHAGREFWASRKLFGRLAICRARNPNLRDKAGREGLIDNTASRSMQILVVHLLKSAARRYFGTDSEPRKEFLPTIEEANEAASAKAKAARSGQLNAFRKAIRGQISALESSLSKAESLERDLLTIITEQDGQALWGLASRVNELVELRAELRPPPKPKKLGPFEERYRDYRDKYAAMAATTEHLRSQWVSHTEHLQAKPSIDVARSHLGSTQKAVTDRLIRWKKSIVASLNGEIMRIQNQVDVDLKEFYKAVAPLLDDVEHNRTPLSVVLAEMDRIRDDLSVRFADFYDPYLRAITRLSEGVDLDGAFAYAGDQEEALSKRLEQVQSLAQIGISVEILSHELQSLDGRLSSALETFPENIRRSENFARADNARRELVERLRFLSQVQIAGGDVRVKITGSNIEKYIRDFFGNLLPGGGAGLKATNQFREAAFYEFPSRIYPVFINLVNNSLYWIAERPKQEILLSASSGALIISDTGPGIDSDDTANLFEIFFTRRIRGRGVGLYLCRQTLAAGGHRIEFMPNETDKILPGANFLITLRNGFDG